MERNNTKATAIVLTASKSCYNMCRIVIFKLYIRIGAGGLGALAALYLAAAGVGHIGIVDADEVDLSNLQRQVMTYVPGEGPCYRCVFKNPLPKDAVPTCKQAGVIGAMAGTIGTLEAMGAIKYIIGKPSIS